MNAREAKRHAYAVAAELLMENADALEAMDDRADLSRRQLEDRERHVAAQRELAEQLAGVVMRWGPRDRRPPQAPGQLALED